MQRVIVDEDREERMKAINKAHIEQLYALKLNRIVNASVEQSKMVDIKPQDIATTLMFRENKIKCYKNIKEKMSYEQIEQLVLSIPFELDRIECIKAVCSKVDYKMLAKKQILTSEEIAFLGEYREFK